MRDMVAYWLQEQWFVIVYICKDRVVGGCVIDKVKEVGLPPPPLHVVRDRWGPQGGRKFGAIHPNIPGFESSILKRRLS